VAVSFNFESNVSNGAFCLKAQSVPFKHMGDNCARINFENFETIAIGPFLFYFSCPPRKVKEKKSVN